jgi:pyruvate formate lyase activating enzyme
MKEALFYRQEAEGAVRCSLCNHRCRIAQGKEGLCRVRKNNRGMLYSLNYGRIVAANLDPIEKKPLFHLLPGSSSYSIAASGCNFRCGFCQNWEISQIQADGPVFGGEASPRQVVEEAVRRKAVSVSYTYTEPTIYFEFAYDCAVLAREAGLRNIFVTNGYMTDDALKYIGPYLDAANVDLKSFRDDFYKKICHATLPPVLDTIISLRHMGIWVEVTTLIIPGVNDSHKELAEIASFLASVDKDIPWHISRFHPDYEMNQLSVTPPEVLQEAYHIGRSKGLHFVYIGNMPTDSSEATLCPHCSKPVVERHGFFVESNRMQHGRCGFCKGEVAGVWV